MNCSLPCDSGAYLPYLLLKMNHSLIDNADAYLLLK